MNKRFRIAIEDLFTGKHIWQNYKFLEQSQWWDQERMAAYRREKLTRILEHCYRNVPAYSELMRNAGVGAEDIGSDGILQALPVIDKQYILDHYNDFLPLNYRSIKGVQHSKTSGTTGQVLNYTNDAGSRSMVWASFMRFKDWMGYDQNSLFIVFRGRNFVTESMFARMRLKVTDLIKNYKTFDAYNLRESDIDRLVDVLNKNENVVLRGYVLNLVDIASALKSRGLVFHLKAVNTTAEPLLDFHRGLLSQVFSCDVFDQYGFGEIGGVAYECNHHSGLHVTEEHVIIETVNGGEMVITDLDNYSFPFIRYRTGDKAQMKNELCSCGRNSQLIKSIDGRTSDNIMGLNGNSLHWGYFHHLLIYTGIATKRNMIKFQVLQPEPSKLVLNLVSDPVDSEEKKRLTDLIIQKLGPMEVTVNNVNDIPKDVSGKFRAVISGSGTRLI